jgi:hypothetical protein
MASYFCRLAAALQDQHKLKGYETFEDAAGACTLVLGADAAHDLAQRLGPTAHNTVQVARLLGYDPRAAE